MTQTEIPGAERYQDKELTEAIAEYMEARKAAKMAKLRETAAKDYVQRLMEEREIEQYHADDLGQAVTRWSSSGLSFRKLPKAAESDDG